MICRGSTWPVHIYLGMEPESPSMQLTKLTAAAQCVHAYTCMWTLNVCLGALESVYLYMP